MEWSILFLGPVGVGKTQAIMSISDIDIVGTEAGATADAAAMQHQAAVAVEMGVMHLGDKDKVVLYGAPGQDRFEFMWKDLLDQVKGLVLLLDHSKKDPIADLAHYMELIRRLTMSDPKPMVIGVTHADLAIWRPLDVYRHYLRSQAADIGGGTLPVFRVDARGRRDVNNLLLALTSMMDYSERFARRGAA